MQSPRFGVGARVRTLRPLAGLPVGSNGRIFRAVRAIHLYGVLFDGEVLLRVMYGDDLEQVALQERQVGKPVVSKAASTGIA
jgi:hypothetical protein